MTVHNSAMDGIDIPSHSRFVPLQSNVIAVACIRDMHAQELSI